MTTIASYIIHDDDELIGNRLFYSNMMLFRMCTDSNLVDRTPNAILLYMSYRNLSMSSGSLPFVIHSSSEALHFGLLLSTYVFVFVTLKGPFFLFPSHLSLFHSLCLLFWTLRATYYSLPCALAGWYSIKNCIPGYEFGGTVADTVFGFLFSSTQGREPGVT